MDSQNIRIRLKAFDHRVLDGVRALKFLKLVVQGLSQPMGLLVA